MAETKKRIIQFDATETFNNDDYLLIDGETDGTRKILASNVGGSGGRGVDYSTAEQDTGLKWIDGKPIYQKTVDFGTLPNNSSKSVSSGVATLDTLVDMQGTMRWPSGTQASIHANNAQEAVTAFIMNANGDITCTTWMDRSDLTAIITIKYTKTTDTV